MALDSGHLPTRAKGMFYTPTTLQPTADNDTIISGFSANNPVGYDVLNLLQVAFNQIHLHVKCVALVNDVGAHMLATSVRRSSDLSMQTVGSLLSRSCAAGAILGTGTDGAYPKDLSGLTKLKDQALNSSGWKPIVNTESGCFQRFHTLSVRPRFCACCPSSDKGLEVDTPRSSVW